MSRMPAAGSAKQSTYRVSDGYRIGNNEGGTSEEGDDISLTKKQAQFLHKKGAIFVPIEDDDDEDADDTGAATSTESAQADGDGDEPTRQPPKRAIPKTTRKL